MTPAEHLRAVCDAPAHERPAALRIAADHWASSYVPHDIDAFITAIATNSFPGLSRHDLSVIAPLIDDQHAVKIVRSLTTRAPAIDALLDHRDPEAFLALIADLRDGVTAPRGWWPADASPLLTALHLSQVPDVVPVPPLTKSDWVFLFIGASPAPHRLIPVRTITRHRRDPNLRFAKFALENPHLAVADREILLSLMHPAVVAGVAADTVLSSSTFSEWLDGHLVHGTDTDVINCLATTQFATTAVASSPRALRLSLMSTLPSIRRFGLAHLATIVTPEDIPLAAALIAANTAPLDDIADLVAACRRKPATPEHLLL
jgi:hypothetical protein